MNSKRILFIALIACATLGLAPYQPEPHIIGKFKWMIGGAHGMQLMDYVDLLLHGAPWLLLVYALPNWMIKKYLHKKSTS